MPASTNFFIVLLVSLHHLQMFVAVPVMVAYSGRIFRKKGKLEVPLVQVP